MLRGQGRRASRRDDVWVRRALAWLRSPSRKQPWHQVIAQAHALYQQDGLTRWHLEARLLTHQPLHEVAACCSLSPATVEAYAALFFDVRDHLGARDWLHHRALPPGYWLDGFRRDDVRSLLRLAALRGGPLVLDRALRVLTSVGGTAPPRPASLDQLAEALDDLHCRVWLVVQTLPLAAFRLPLLGTLQQLCQALQDLDHCIDQAACPGPLDLVRREMCAELVGAPTGEHPPGTMDGLVVRLHGLGVAVEHLERLALLRAA